MKSKILILGAGHLTTPLIRELANSHQLMATRSTANKLAELETLGAIPIHYSIGEGPHALPQKLDILIISTPPRKGLDEVFNYISAKQVLFISSTAVYGEQGPCNETSEPRSNSVSGELLAHYESLLRQRYKHGLTIIRPGGLVDCDRHPGKFLSGKIIKDPWERVHLIHEKDVRWVIKKLIEKGPGACPQILNLIHPERAYKFDFYRDYCCHQGLALPEKNPELKDRPIAPNFKRDITSIESDQFLRNLPLYPIDGRQP